MKALGVLFIAVAIGLIILTWWIWRNENEL